MNGIDLNDQDSLDYSTSICTSRWYIRIFCWALDRVVHAQHTIVTFLAEQGIGKPEWKKYRGKIRADMFSKFILGYLFSIMVSALTGMEHRKRDLAICKQVRSSPVNVRNASSA